MALPKREHLLRTIAACAMLQEGASKHRTGNRESQRDCGSCGDIFL